MAEPDLRIEIYARLSRLTSGKAIRALRAEVDDRFGALPPEVETLFALHPEGLPPCHGLAAARPDVVLKGAKLLWDSPAAPDADPVARAEALLDMLEEVEARLPA